MTQQSNRDAWRKFLGINDARNGRADARTGVGVGRSAGRASGAGSTDRDGNPEGEAGESAEKGNGALDASKRLKTGDKGDRLEDLYDCETGEKVTIDGLGKEGTQAYPMSFQDCNDPNAGDDPSYTWYYEMRTHVALNVASRAYTKSYDTAIAWITGQPRHGWSTFPTLPRNNGDIVAQAVNSMGMPQGDPAFRRWTVVAWDKNITPPPEGALETKWPQADKNHLNWNQEKGCFEALCPELNTQVDEKFQGCKDELELCDAPVGGKKVKVKINNGVTEVTQERYNQTATIKDGKVTSVKALSESQTEAVFKK